MTQLYVVRDPKDGTTYIFDNHEAALACRKDMKLPSDCLVGQSIIHSQWPAQANYIQNLRDRS